MVQERNNIKKMKKQLNKNLSCLIRTSARQRSQVHPRGKDLFTLIFLFSQCASFFSTLDTG